MKRFSWQDLEDVMYATMTDRNVIGEAFAASDMIQSFPERDVEAMQRYTMLVLNCGFANLVDALGGPGAFDAMVDSQIDTELAEMLNGDVS